MARSYQSALPTWSTYTPHVSPLGIQAPINQQTWWRNRTTMFQPGGIAGELNRAALGIDQMVRGTGAGAAAVAMGQHRPVLAALQQAGQTRRSNRQWAKSMQEALQRQAPEDIVEPGEEHPQSEMQVRAARTAASSVNPNDVQTQQAARDFSGTMVAQTVGSPKAGTATLNMSGAEAGQQRATKRKGK